MNPETREFLEAVRHAEDPTADDERRVLSALRATLAAGVGASTLGATKATLGSAEATKAAGLGAVSGGLKLTGAGLLLVVAGGVAVHSARSGSGDARPPPEPAPAHQAANSVAPVETLSPAASAPTASQSAVTSAPTASVTRAGASRPVPAPDPTPLGPPSLRAELTLLGEVESALSRGEAAVALRLLDGHVTTDRQLVAERKAARVLALCALGRSDEARRSAAEFFRQHPASPQWTAIERSCAGLPDGSER